MKRLWLSVLFMALGLFATAQTPLSEAQSNEIMASLTKTASSMQTMQCRFVQSKTMSMLAEPSVSEGKMYFASPDRLRWEYVKPYAFALVVNGERIVKITDGQAEALDGNSGRMYQGITSMIMGSASGKKLFDATTFDIVLYDDGACWKAEMTPKRRDMKRMFSQLVFHFDKKTQVIDHVEFLDPKGDNTVIRFEEIRLNEKIGEEQFQ
jgi:outer membrane lipoprotein carrier protein